MCACRTKTLGVRALGESSSGSHIDLASGLAMAGSGAQRCFGVLQKFWENLLTAGLRGRLCTPEAGAFGFSGSTPEPCLGCRVPSGPRYSPSWAFCPQWVPSAWCRTGARHGCGPRRPARQCSPEKPRAVPRRLFILALRWGGFPASQRSNCRPWVGTRPPAFR